MNFVQLYFWLFTFILVKVKFTPKGGVRGLAQAHPLVGSQRHQAKRNLVSKFSFSIVNTCILKFLKFYYYVFLISLNFINCGFNLTMKPEMISKTLVNQMLLCFGVIFAAQVVEYSNGLVFAYFLLYMNQGCLMLLMLPGFTYSRIVVGCSRFLELQSNV